MSNEASPATTLPKVATPPMPGTPAVVLPANRTWGQVQQTWQPEDPAFWANGGAIIARRNLWISIPALFLAFCVWMVWSVVAAKLPDIGFTFSTAQLFWLAALPGLTGATLRIPYSFMVPLCGGRRWTALSTAALLIPAVWMGVAVRNPATPYWEFVGIALTCGLGGANFASSMANISFFYPKRLAGTALGLNAGLGNLGVSGMQFLVPQVLTLGTFSMLTGSPQRLANGKEIWLQNAAFIWVVPVAVVAVLAWVGMNDLASARASVRTQLGALRHGHTWIVCGLYTATFGSFIGYSAAFVLLVKTQFHGVDVLRFAFWGPLLGALARPLGGWLADRLGGARVTFWNFGLMMAAVLGVVHFLPRAGQPEQFTGFFVLFLVLFTSTGIGNGSIYRMIPVIFRGLHVGPLGTECAPEKLVAAQRQASQEAAAAIGFVSAVAAYGMFIIPVAFKSAVAASGGAAPALLAFFGFYVLCMLATWWHYHRPHAALPC